MEYVYATAAALLAYAAGSLSFAVIVSRVMGLRDPRTYGSNNPGATNVLRSGNKAAAVATLLLDALKGWLPVMLVKWFGREYGLGDGTVALAGFAALALVASQIYQSPLPFVRSFHQALAFWQHTSIAMLYFL